AQGEELLQQRIREGGDNEKKTVGVVGASFPDLPRVEDEILAQHRQLNVLAGIAKIFQRTGEKFRFGKDGKSGGAGGFERFGEGGRVKRITKDAAGGRSGLQFGDNIECVARQSG